MWSFLKLLFLSLSCWSNSGIGRLESSPFLAGKSVGNSIESAIFGWSLEAAFEELLVSGIYQDAAVLIGFGNQTLTKVL